MSIYSTQFYVGNLVAGTNNLVYTVPAGYVAVFRGVDYRAPGPPNELIFSLVGGVNPSFMVVGSNAAIGLGDGGTWNGYQVFDAGQAIEVYLTGSHNGWCAISGYLLALP